MLTRTPPREIVTVRLKPDIKRALEQWAKSRRVSFSKAAAYVLEQCASEVIARENGK